MMLTDQDKEWLHHWYPALTVDETSIHGLLRFTATYNSTTDKFVSIYDGVEDSVGGDRITGEFRVRIEERLDKSQFRLPALMVDDIEPVINRHFNPGDGTACLGSSLEEDEFFTPNLQFQGFFERAVIPFLYGQAFYSTNGRWPWNEYGHGYTGLLESYLKLADPSKASECLQKLALSKNDWPTMKLLLASNAQLKGHDPCPFCTKRDHLRRCHMSAWKGFCKLRQDIKAGGVSLPD